MTHSLIENFYVGKIARQHQSENSEQVRHEVDHESGGLESVRIKLHPGLTVAAETGKDKQYSTGRGNNPQPCSEAGGDRLVSLKLHEFAQCDGEASDGANPKMMVATPVRTHARKVRSLAR